MNPAPSTRPTSPVPMIPIFISSPTISNSKPSKTKRGSKRSPSVVLKRIRSGRVLQSYHPDVVPPHNARIDAAKVSCDVREVDCGALERCLADVRNFVDPEIDLVRIEIRPDSERYGYVANPA